MHLQLCHSCSVCSILSLLRCRLLHSFQPVVSLNECLHKHDKLKSSAYFTNRVNFTLCVRCVTMKFRLAAVLPRRTINAHCKDWCIRFSNKNAQTLTLYIQIHICIWIRYGRDARLAKMCVVCLDHSSLMSPTNSVLCALGTQFLMWNGRGYWISVFVAALRKYYTLNWMQQRLSFEQNQRVYRK